ncbi:MAG: OsmC family protein [Bacteroidota bacterium]
MSTSVVEYKGGLRTEMKHLRSGNIVLTDAPVDNKGKGEAFSPTDIVATSLAACMLTIIGINADSNGYSIIGTKVSVTKIMYDNPRRIGEIELVFNFPDLNYSDKQKKLIINCAKTCPVAKSLGAEVKQTLSFNF